MASRTDRLLKLLQLLRASRHPKSARLLAQELGISVRSVYRDIDTLRGQGAVIGGAWVLCCSRTAICRR